MLRGDGEVGLGWVLVLGCLGFFVLEGGGGLGVRGLIRMVHAARVLSF